MQKLLKAQRYSSNSGVIASRLAKPKREKAKTQFFNKCWRPNAEQ